MADASSTAGIVVDQLRRQVDHQISAATATDTKAAGLIAATFALTALLIPRVRADGTLEVGVAVATLGAVFVTLLSLLLSIAPRVAGFSYGPDAADMIAFVDDGDDPADLEAAIAHAFVSVRATNEKVMAEKSDRLVTGIASLIVTVLGLGAMLAVGAIE